MSTVTLEKSISTCSLMNMTKVSVWHVNYSTGLIHISHPIYISVVCFAAWLTASCYKYSEAHNKLFRSCHSSSCCEIYGTSSVPFSTHYTPVVFCALWSEILFSYASLKVSLSKNLLCLSNDGDRSGTGMQCFFFKLTEVIPLVATSLFLWIHPMGKHTSLQE